MAVLEHSSLHVDQLEPLWRTDQNCAAPSLAPRGLLRLLWASTGALPANPHLPLRPLPHLQQTLCEAARRSDATRPWVGVRGDGHGAGEAQHEWAGGGWSGVVGADLPTPPRAEEGFTARRHQGHACGGLGRPPRRLQRVAECVPGMGFALAAPALSLSLSYLSTYLSIHPSIYLCFSERCGLAAACKSRFVGAHTSSFLTLLSTGFMHDDLHKTNKHTNRPTKGPPTAPVAAFPTSVPSLPPRIPVLQHSIRSLAF